MIPKGIKHQLLSGLAHEGHLHLTCILLPVARPERPRDLELTDLAERSVRLTWIPGDDNNSPITGQHLFLYFETVQGNSVAALVWFPF